MKYKYNLEIRNETEKDEIFKQYKQTIYEHILYEINGLFHFDLDLLVVFREIDKDKIFMNEETYSAGTTLIENRYAIILDIASLENFSDYGECNLAISIHHELCHVYDLSLMMHNKRHSVNPLRNDYNTLKDFSISKGWRFWTEFHAYFLTYKRFKDEYSRPTFSQIVKGYEEIKKQSEEIKLISDFETEESETLLRELKRNVEDFIYFTAKYLAGSILKENDGDTCDEKITESASSVRMNEICRESIMKLLPLVRKEYGMGLAKKLYNLGKYLLKDIYEEFNIFTVECEGRILFAYSD